MTIKETLNLLETTVKNNTYGRRKIEMSVPSTTFYSFAKYLCFLLKSNPEERTDVNVENLKSYSFRVDGKLIVFKKELVNELQVITKVM